MLQHSPKNTIDLAELVLPHYPRPSGLPPFVAMDFETSGNESDSACALGMVRIEDAAVAGSFYRLIRPPHSNVLYSDIHGLTWPMLKDQPTFGELWPEIAAFIDGAAFFTAHNAAFDRRVLLGCCEANGIAAPGMPFYCTVKASRRAWHYPHNNLSAVCERLNLPLDHHHALSDALACALIYLFAKDAGVDDTLIRTPREQCSPRVSRPKKTKPDAAQRHR